VAKFADCVRCAVTGAGYDGVFCCEEVEAALYSDFSASALDGVSVSSDSLMCDIHASSEYWGQFDRRDGKAHCFSLLDEHFGGTSFLVPLIIFDDTSPL